MQIGTALIVLLPEVRAPSAQADQTVAKKIMAPLTPASLLI